MVLRLLVCIALVVFCVWEGFTAASIPTAEGRHYFPSVYILVSVLLLSGLNKYGLMSWPVASVLLLWRGHWIVGWVPMALVIFNVVGNRLSEPRRREDVG